MTDDDRNARIRNDAEGAMTPSQADPKNDGVKNDTPGAGRDATRPHDHHASPGEPDTGEVPTPAG